VATQCFPRAAAGNSGRDVTNLFGLEGTSVASSPLRWYSPEQESRLENKAVPETNTRSKSEISPYYSKQEGNKFFEGPEDSSPKKDPSSSRVPVLPTCLAQ